MEKIESQEIFKESPRTPNKNIPGDVEKIPNIEKLPQNHFEIIDIRPLA